MRIFVAGATGATGSVFAPRARAAGHTLVLHVRPKSKDTPVANDPDARVFDLADANVRAEAMLGADAIVCLVGTMRKRFAAGDTYATSDVGAVKDLVAGAKAAGVPRLLLLSSRGAGGMGAYLKAKAESERVVKDSGLRWTIFRPSFLVSPEGAASAHGARKVPAPVGGAIRALGAVPGLRGWADDTKPIPIEVVCDAFLRVLAAPRDGAVLEGRDIWRIGAGA